MKQHHAPRRESQFYVVSIDRPVRIALAVRLSTVWISAHPTDKWPLLVDTHTSAHFTQSSGHYKL